jgi:hypothetical protein
MSEERAAAVLRMLEADLPPSTVDIDRAVRAGRRRERARRVLAAGVLAGVTVLAGAGVATVLGGSGTPPARNDPTAATATAVPQACVATVLPGQKGEVGAISPDGRFVVGAIGVPAVPLLWTDGPATTVPVPAGVAATPHAVNDDGVIVGLARRNDRTVPFAVRGGAYSELPLPAGAEGAAHGVNARGDVVGVAFWTSGETRPLLWKASGGVTTLRSGTQWATAFAIGDDGTVFGTLGDGAAPYAWGPDGTGRALPTIPGPQQGKAMAVAGDYVFGHAGTAGDPSASGQDRSGQGRSGQDKGRAGGGEPRWVRWRVSTGAVTEVSGLSATGVDANGAVIGAVRDGETFVPARWRDGKVVELPAVAGSAPTGWVVATSHDGSRLVGHIGTGEATTPVEWRCS